MTEPENFEDDLFADLYDDNDASRAPQAPSAAPAVDPPKNEDQTMISPSNEHAQQDQKMHHGEGDEDDDDDDDDDVDFNLGGRDNSNALAAHLHDVDASTPPYGTVHKASAKDDG
ncbi:hypothetical protein C2857_007247 [Epichloe festucae Fl1]|uniref:Uncharacterized protein n=1 Tax=Epichloe festucae (strain Fl1) TaxID=877507 RepID=A0A7S9KQK5_EPIFF|nr:hypothetical protein C2857_007247 [Epichloe festucae Fl1]